MNCSVLDGIEHLRQNCCPIVSIHAPAKGATMEEVIAREVGAVSIHAPAKGATQGEDVDAWLKDLFQSTLPRRERLRTACI